MIVCLCLNVSDRRIRKLASEGLSLEEVIGRTKVGSECGHCLRMVAEIHQEAASRAGDRKDREAA